MSKDLFAGFYFPTILELMDMNNPPTLADIDALFHAPSPDAQIKYDAIRLAGKSLALAILGNTPPGAAQMAAILMVRQAVNLGNDAVPTTGPAAGQPPLALGTAPSPQPSSLANTPGQPPATPAQTPSIAPGQPLQPPAPYNRP